MKNNFLKTHSGKLVDPFNVHPDSICLEDIAHALSLTCRYGGHVDELLSVAEHSIIVAFCVFLDTKSVKLAYAALFHDATEAYIQDIVSPVKHRLKDYLRLEKKLEKVINTKFGIKLKLKDKKVIKKYDIRARYGERNRAYGYLSAKIAERNFLRLARYLKHAILYNYPNKDINEILVANLV